MRSLGISVEAAERTHFVILFGEKERKRVCVRDATYQMCVCVYSVCVQIYALDLYVCMYVGEEKEEEEHQRKQTQLQDA